MNNIKKRQSEGRVCCVPGCFSTYRRNPELKFYSFPNREWEIQRKKNWIARVRRKPNGSQPWVPTKYTSICSLHFVGREKSNDPRKENYNPTIFPWNPEKLGAVERRERLKARNESKEIEFPKTNNNFNYGNMELAMEFATFCNICFSKQSLRKIEETEHILNTLMIFIENKIVLKNQEVYLCLNCCEKLEFYDQFKEMCLVNFIDFRLQYLKLKNKLETCNDVNMEAKLRNFIEIKVYGSSESLAMDDSENFTKVPLQNSEKNLIETQSVLNDNNYNFHSIKCKTEKNECEDNEEYKFHTDVHLKNNENEFELPVAIETQSVINDNYDFHNVTCKTEKNECEDNEEYKFHTDVLLKNNENEFELPVAIEHIKMESFIDEDIGATESTGKNEFIEPPKSTESLPQYEEHSTSIEETHKEKKRYSCSVCDKTYTKITNLKAHEGTHTGEMAHICNICNKAFGLPDRLKEHMFLHSNEVPYTCLICNKNFKTLRYLKRHKVSHTDEKPFACSMCDKTFTNSGNLKMHENVHTGEKPYTCEICQKAFRLISSLNLHKRIHTGEKPYTCDVCQKSFRLLNHVRAHERIHSGEKPYECPVCKMRFTQLHSCKIHQLTHTGEKPHSCNVCKKTFRELNTLKDHERLHTGDRPYNCDICKKSFIRRDQLRKHKKKPCVAVEEQIT